jgi:steroid delta-isomerase-like uncharacterized protein
MSAENNATVRRMEQAVATGDEATIDELCDPSLVDHTPAPDQEPTLAGLKATYALYRQAFPDIAIDLEAVVAEGDDAATRWTAVGTHQGEFFGVAPTGRQITVRGMNFYRLRDGRVTDIWTQFDGLGMMEQLGALPS